MENDNTDDERPMHLVVVGASAGGIEALSALVAALPPEFPAPIVIAQHISPHRVSSLAEILARRTPLPVRTVISREPLAAGRHLRRPARPRRPDHRPRGAGPARRRRRPASLGRSPLPQRGGGVRRAADRRHPLGFGVGRRRRGTGGQGRRGNGDRPEPGQRAVSRYAPLARAVDRRHHGQPRQHRTAAARFSDRNLRGAGQVGAESTPCLPRSIARGERDRLQHLQATDDHPPPPAPDGGDRAGDADRLRPLRPPQPRGAATPDRQFPDQGHRVLSRPGTLHLSARTGGAGTDRRGPAPRGRTPDLVGRLRDRRGSLLAGDAGRRSTRRGRRATSMSASSRPTSTVRRSTSPGKGSIRSARCPPSRLRWWSGSSSGTTATTRCASRFADCSSSGSTIWPSAPPSPGSI